MHRHCFARATLILSALVFTALPATAGHKPAQVPSSFSNFPHDRHNNYWGAKQLNCMSCHAFGDGGNVSWVDSDSKPLSGEDFRQLCHQCHVAERDYQPLVQSSCETCHDSPPVPATHGAGWVEAHGADARIEMAECRTCHKASFCVDCHERKESVRYNVHDRTWLAVHGMAARTSPQGCDDCHVKSTCNSCHKAAGGRWP